MEKYNKLITKEQIAELISGKTPVEAPETKRYSGILNHYSDIINTLHESYKLSYLQVHKFLQIECGIKCTYLTLLNFIKKNTQNNN